MAPHPDNCSFVLSSKSPRETPKPLHVVGMASRGSASLLPAACPFTLAPQSAVAWLPSPHSSFGLLSPSLKTQLAAMPLPRSGPSWIMSHSQIPLPVPQPLLPFSTLPQNPPLSTEEGLCILSPLRHLPKAPSSQDSHEFPQEIPHPSGKSR